jgi:lysozyme family protein
MKHPFEILRPDYERLLATMRNTRLREAEAAAHRYRSWIDRYRPVHEATGVPLALIAALHYRESSGDFRTNLANGDPLTGPTTHVPAGRPPLLEGMTFPVGWGYAAIDALRYDHLDDTTHPWTWPYACYAAESYNGFGPRARGVHTGYLWSGTNHYLTGKYVADGLWNPDKTDNQLGVVPLMAAMVRQDASLALAGDPPGAADLSVLPGFKVPRTEPPAPPPDGVGHAVIAGGVSPVEHVRMLQARLNELKVEGTPLVVDGNYGRRTREAVRAFQRLHDLEADGLAGPLTRTALAKKE